MTLSTHRLSKVLRNLFGSWRVSPLEGGRPRTGTVPRPSADVPQPAPGPLSTPATLRKPEAGSGEPTAREDAEEAWTAKTCPIHQTGDLIEGRYEVQERFEGAMGYVYIARDSTQDLTFAIKQPKEQMLANRDVFARVLREADAWTGLGMHPHIAYCYFVKSLEGVPHIFVEYVDGGNLRDWIAEGRCPDERARLELAIQFCHGMEHAHGRGMIHRDIKPENILVTREGTVKVTDFGLVGEAAGRALPAPAGGEARGTRFGDLMGTPAYMAPEQIADPRQRSAKVPEGVWTDSDVYSFGICLWELFCGGRPDQFETTGEAAIQRARPDLPARLGELLLATVAKDRADRPQDFAALRERLNGIYRELFQEEAPSYRIEMPETAADELNNQGYSYFELGKPEEARACFELARETEPTNPQATYNLSLLQWRAGEIDDLEVLRRLENCKTNPTVDKQALAELTAYIHAERFAPDQAREVLSEHPGRFDALFGGVELGQVRCVRKLEGHTDEVRAAALSASRAVSGSKDKTIKFWDPLRGKCLLTLEGHTGSVEALSLSANRRWLLSGSDDKTLKFWDLETGLCLSTLEGHTGSVNAVALSSDGSLGLSGSGDQTLKLWDLNTASCLHTMEGHTDRILEVSLSADGRRALSAGLDNRFRLWDLENGTCLRSFGEHVDRILAISLSTDGRRALFSVKNSDVSFSAGTLFLWDLEKGTCLRTLQAHISAVTDLALSPDGRQAFSGSEYGSLGLWDLDRGSCLFSLRQGAACVFPVALSADGRWGLSGDDRTLLLWDLVPSTRYVSGLQLATLRGFESRQQEQRALEQAVNDAEIALAAGDCRAAYHCLFAAWEAVRFQESVPVRTLYSRLLQRGLPSRAVLASETKVLEGHMGDVWAVALSADGRRAVSASKDCTLKLWDLEKGSCLHTLEGHASQVTRVALTSDSRRALSGCLDGTLKLWDLDRGSCLRTLTGHTGYVLGVSLSLVGRRALSGSEDQTLKLWDLETGTCLRTMGDNANASTRLLAVALSAYGERAISGSSDGIVKLWNVETGERLIAFKGHKDWVTALALSADGRWALSGSADNTLKLWDLKKVALSRILQGHTAMVVSVALRASGRWVLSGSDDGTLRLWDLATSKCHYVLRAPAHAVRSVALSHDGQWAVSGGRDGTVRLWRIIWELEFPEEA